jgi:hypothetical protein
VRDRQHCRRDGCLAAGERQKYSLYVSALVLQESRRGEPAAVRKREQALKGIPLLGTTPATEELAEFLVTKGPIPREYPEDALHIALASTSEMEYLLTWNFRHINNATMKSDVARIVAFSGYECPVICAPEELLEGDYENSGSHS